MRADVVIYHGWGLNQEEREPGTERVTGGGVVKAVRNGVRVDVKAGQWWQRC